MHGGRTTLGRGHNPQKMLSPGLGFTVMQYQLATAAKTLKDKVGYKDRNVRQVKNTKKKDGVIDVAFSPQ